ncbi:hypothetical protein B7R54_09565 [Subtercola boreus]|uniref:SMP-30/Gluconolactonase/LRE-like region domain-containing protein n=1 Tax=Subtercola boreus TaxID=120213 RepID=A0A3E0VKQ1_9MICO|nr:putative Ig domain-containing protein [Subtercola boreus]RFA09447.1 hypothetical protein B7R54_09565 [Subtercola boreus]TQL53504.1 DNA-binding beta-propeller fold protein YncE [Subtercola boreus]
MKPIIRRRAVALAVTIVTGSLALALTGITPTSADAKPLDALVADLGPSAKPVAAVTDAAGTIFVLNEGDATVSKVTPTGVLTRVFASLGTAARPQAMTIDPKGYLFVACAGTDSVTRISPTGIAIPYWAYDGVGAMPRGITSDPAGNVFAANWGTSTITKIAATGAVTPVFARLDPADRPLGLTADAAGSLYVADTQTDRISKVSASGAVREVFAALPKGPGLPTGPFGVAVDPWGTVVVTSSSGAVSTFASDGSVLKANAALPAGPHHPTGVLLDAFGDAFVGDELSHGVTVLDATGSPATSIADLGPGSLIRAVTLSGSALFAADYVSGAVRKVELAPTLPSPALNSTVRRGLPAALDVATTGLATKLIVSVGVLPPGLTLDESTGHLTGTPTVPGTYAFDVVAANHWGVTPPQHEVLTVVR